MVRAPAHALPRPLGFALLHPAEKPRLDSTRILTMSGTAALNLLAFGLLMMPLSMPPPAIPPDAAPRDAIRWLPRAQLEPEPVEFVKPRPLPLDARPIEKRAVAEDPVESASSDIPTDTGTEYLPTAGNDTGAADSIAIVDTGPAAMKLEYRQAPAPDYPRRALQRRLSGTVMLDVLVGTDGRPLEVTVAQSSGHRELDEAARAQVLARWSFQPASRNGQAVQAIGRVPIQFALRD